jgi:hypothetical protein
MYELKELPISPDIATNNFITREEFERTLQDLRNLLNRPEAPAAAELPPTTNIPLNF